MENISLLATHGLMIGGEESLTTYGAGDVGSGPDANIYGYKDVTMLVLVYTVAILGMPGNILTLVVMASSSTLRNKPVNRFIIHQAAIDLLSCVLKVADEVVMETNTVAPVLCHLITSKIFSAITFYASTWNMVFLTIERYFAITNPLKYDPDKTRRRLPFVFLVNWIIASCVLIIISIGTDIVGGVCLPGYHVLRTVWMDYIYTPGCFVVSFVLPLVIMIFCYARMYIALRNSARATASFKEPADSAAKTTTDQDAMGHKRRLAQMNIFKTCLTIAILTGVCWAANVSSLFLYIIRYYPHLANDHANYGQWLLVLNSFLNPYVYVLRYEEFQVQLRKLCKCKPKPIQSK